MIVLSLICLLPSCATMHYVKKDGTPIMIGQIPAARTLETINAIVPEAIRLKAYPNNTACLIADYNGNYHLEICLDEILMAKMTDDLEKAILWGNTAKTEKVEIKKNLDYIKNDMTMSFYGLNMIFMSVNEGRSWSIAMTFSYYNAMAATSYSTAVNSNPQQTMILPESSVRKLLSYLKESDQYFVKAQDNQAKLKLFQ